MRIDKIFGCARDDVKIIRRFVEALYYEPGSAFLWCFLFENPLRKKTNYFGKNQQFELVTIV